MKRNKQYKEKQKLGSFKATIKRRRSLALFEWLKEVFVKQIHNDSMKEFTYES